MGIEILVGCLAFDCLFKLYSVERHISFAILADDTHVASDSENLEELISAWMRLFKFEDVADLYFKYLHIRLRSAARRLKNFCLISAKAYTDNYNI